MFPDVSSQLDLGFSSLAGIPQEWCCVLIAYDLQFVPLLLMCTLITQLESARLTHCKADLFPFVINRHFKAP